MSDVLDEAARIGRAGEPAALVTVVAASGSTPRHPGAKMIVRADGGIAGTIGGGRIELEAIAAAAAIARGEAPAARLRRHLVRDLAMCCGGAMEVWLEPLDGARWKALGEAARRRRARRPCALVTSLGDAGGGGKDVLGDDPCLAPGGRARLEGDRFVEPVRPPARLVLFGGGHVARATAPLAARVGFEVVVCDDEPGAASPERFPDAAALVHSFDVRDVERELPAFGRGDLAVIFTRDHAVDQAILEQLLPREELAFLGLIGSRGKVERFRGRLEQKGVATPERWARLRAPVGLEIGAETPEEIAVAIVAELVRRRNVGA